MEFIDLKAQYQALKPRIEARISRVLEHGKYILGPEVEELEERLAEYVGVRHCIGVSSGTDALLIALMAVGVRHGDEVITTPFSFISTAETIVLLGAKPVFIDIDPATYNLDARLLEGAISERTRAIVPVSLFGQCPDLTAINAIAVRHGIPVIEDGAQSFGATHNGKRSCGITTIGCTSFFPSKPLGCYGDGGACFTDDDELARAMREIRVHGQERRYFHSRVGVNGRLDTLQAAVLLAKLEVFPEEIKARRSIGMRYTEMLRGLVDVPEIAEGNASVYAQYTISVDQRDAVREQLARRGIPTAVHYPIPLHRQPALAMQVEGLRAADYAAERVLSLPMHPFLDRVEQQRIVESLAGILR